MADYYYQTSEGITIDFHGDIWSDEHWLYGYEHEASMEMGVFTDIELKPYERTVPLYIRGSSQEHAMRIRNRLHELIQRDIDLGKCGRLYVGLYYLECFITALDDTGASIDLRRITTEATIMAPDGMWKKEVSVSVKSNTNGDGLDFPFDYPIDLMQKMVNEVVNPFTVKSDFILTIYGPCTTPAVIIRNHTYKVNVNVADGEYVVINSAENTIEKRSFSDQSAKLNIFDKRFKEESIFYKIRAGKSNFAKSGEFDVDLILINIRPEPVWESNKWNISYQTET